MEIFQIMVSLLALPKETQTLLAPVQQMVKMCVSLPQAAHAAYSVLPKEFHTERMAPRTREVVSLVLEPEHVPSLVQYVVQYVASSPECAELNTLMEEMAEGVLTKAV